MRSYIGIIHKDPDSCYGVSFPDFPGCITAGDTPDEARAMAAEALAFHIEDFATHGEVMPEPSTLEQVMQDPNNRDGMAILVDLPSAAPKSVRINITMPEDVLEEIDKHAKAQGLSRSAYLARAAKRAMAA